MDPEELEEQNRRAAIRWARWRNSSAAWRRNGEACYATNSGRSGLPLDRSEWLPFALCTDRPTSIDRATDLDRVEGTQ